MVIVNHFYRMNFPRISPRMMAATRYTSGGTGLGGVSVATVWAEGGGVEDVVSDKFTRLSLATSVLKKREIH